MLRICQLFDNSPLRYCNWKKEVIVAPVILVTRKIRACSHVSQSPAGLAIRTRAVTIFSVN